VSSLFESYGDTARIFSYSVERREHGRSEVGKATLVTGTIRVTSEITRDSAPISFSVLHLGDHNISGGVGEFQGEESHGAMASEVNEVFAKADFPETIRRIDHHFGASAYSLRSLFRDEQRKITEQILKETLDEATSAYGRIYEHQSPLMRFLKEMEMPAPRGLQLAAEMHLNDSLRRAFEAHEPDPEAVGRLLQEAERLAISLDAATLEHALRKGIETTVRELRENPSELSRLQRLDAALDVSKQVPFRVNLWRVQNIYHEIARSSLPEVQAKAERGEEEAKEWLERFTAMAERLRMSVH
jgi:hypothetical protein